MCFSEKEKKLHTDVVASQPHVAMSPSTVEAKDGSAYG